MGYKLLGWVVWHGALWFLRRKLRGTLPGRRALVVGLSVAGAAAVAAVAAGGRGAGS
jgi:hypothetical protein